MKCDRCEKEKQLIKLKDSKNWYCFFCLSEQEKNTLPKYFINELEDANEISQQIEKELKENE